MFPFEMKSFLMDLQKLVYNFGFNLVEISSNSFVMPLNYILTTSLSF